MGPSCGKPLILDSSNNNSDRHRGYHLHNWTEKGEERYKLMARQGHGFSMSRAAKVLKTNPASGAMCEVAWDGKEMGEIAVHGNLVMK